MTRTERTIVLHWRGIATLCAILALSGLGIVLWHRIDTQDRLYAAATTEADLRGNAVSTLAGDVRALRAQVKAEGKTPVAPDPTKAIDNLPARAEVPVPIPGPPGPKGDTGSPGSPGPTGSPGKSGAAGSNGTSGEAGAAGPTGADGAQGEPGATGPQGEPGQRGEQGPQGDTGPTGPAPSGWTYTDAAGTSYACTPDGDGSTHYTCRATGGGSTPNPQSPSLLGAAAFTMIARYRRL